MTTKASLAGGCHNAIEYLERLENLLKAESGGVPRHVTDGSKNEVQQQIEKTKRAIHRALEQL